MNPGINPGSRFPTTVGMAVAARLVISMMPLSPEFPAATKTVIPRRFASAKTSDNRLGNGYVVEG